MDDMTNSQLVADDNDNKVIDRVRNMLLTLSADRGHYDNIHQFAAGKQIDIRVPQGVDQTVRDIAKRSVANFIPLALSVPAQLSFADGYSRMSEGDGELLLNPPEWRVWNRSGFRSKQTTLFKTSLKYGVAYLAIEGSGTVDDVELKILSTRNTMAYFRDPVNDIVPVYALRVIPSPVLDEPDIITYYDSERMVTIERYSGKKEDMVIVEDIEHGYGKCPVVRFPCYIDDEGNTSGVVEELRVPQNRINQTVFDLLLTQTFSSARVRFAAGLQGDPVMDPKTGEPLRDENGFIVFKPMQVDQSRMLLTDNPDAKFGTLEETPLDGFIDSFDSAVKTLAVLGSIPPHSLLGSMANLSGETINAAMGQTNRHTHMLKKMWEESIKEVMSIVRTAIGEAVGEDYDDEVRWRDMSDASMAQIADALGKLATNLEIPVRGLWSRVPEVTDAELMKWNLQADKQSEIQDEAALDPVASAERETLDVFGSSVDVTEQGSSLQTSNITSIQEA